MTEARDTARLAGDGKRLCIPVAAKTVIYGGAMVALDATGYAIPAKKATGLTIAGRAEETIDNATGAAGDVHIMVSRGVFLYDNDTSDNAVTQASLLKSCYALDDATVTGLATGASVAGKVIAINDDGVYVEI